MSAPHVVKTALVSLLLLLAGCACEARDYVLRPEAAVIPKEYFGLHMHRADTVTPWPKVPFGSWRLWDAYVAWPNLEPVQGKWDFSRLDRYVAMARLTGVEILLPLGLTPRWASARPNETSAYGPGLAAEPFSLQQWRNYVRIVAERYKGRIKLYEIWNEPNDRSFFTGSIQKMVELVAEANTVLKAVDPGIRILSPAVTGGGEHVLWLDRFLDAGGKKYIDVIAYHFYVAEGKPESMLELVAAVRKIKAKHGLNAIPVWNTESGWLIENREPAPATRDSPGWLKLSADDGAAYVARAMILAWAAGVERYYWYAWDGESMGLIEPSSKSMKLAGVAYGQIARWLQGSTLKECNANRGIWTCEIVDKATQPAWIVWSEDNEQQKFKVPPGKVINEIELLDGTRYAPDGKERHELGIRFKPILFRMTRA